METTLKKMTEEERRQHQHFIIQEWKKDVAEIEAELDAKKNTPEYIEVLNRLKEANARRGIIITGKIC